MKLEITINTVNSASWMHTIGHGGGNIRTDKATFSMFVPTGYRRDEVLVEMSNMIRDFNLFAPGEDDEGIEYAEAVGVSFREAADEILKLNIRTPINYYRSWTYDKNRTAVIAVKELV